MWARGANKRVVASAANAARRARCGEAIAGRDWYALAVAPQAEFLTIRLLEERGVFAFAPTRSVWRKPNRCAKRKVRRTYPEVPGYVFVGFEGAPRWHAALSLATVRGVLGGFGRPRRLCAKAVAHAAGLSVLAPDEQAMMRTGAEFRVGDEVVGSEGALEGVRGRVIAIDGASARLLAPFLGAEREVEAQVWALRAAQ